MAPGEPGYWVYALYTPLIGVTFGLSVLALGIGVIAYVKKFFPDEVSVQQRHDGPSDEVARRTVIAQLAPGRQGHRHRAPLADPGHRRARPRASSASGSASPRSPRWCATRGRADRTPRCGPPAGVRTNGETVYLRRDTGDPDEISLVRPEDQEPGSMETVFPFRESERGDEEALLEGVRAAPTTR